MSGNPIDILGVSSVSWCDGSNLVRHGDGVAEALVFEGIRARCGAIPQGADVFPLSGAMNPENERLCLRGGGAGPVDH